MGWSISVLAVSATAKETAMQALGLASTGQHSRSSEIYFADLASGWRLILAENIAWLTPERLALASREGSVALGCWVEEHVMYSACSRFDEGQQTWSVIHDCNRGLYDLTVEGIAPPELEAIERRRRQMQDEAGGERADTDYLFSAPGEVFHAVCGFWPGDETEDDQALVFTVLEGPGVKSGRAKRRPIDEDHSGGFLYRLGRFLSGRPG
jgi:hypothetical protein